MFHSAGFKACEEEGETQGTQSVLKTESMVRYSGRMSVEDSGGKNECLIFPTVAAESGEVTAEAGHVASETGKVSETGQVAEA